MNDTNHIGEIVFSKSGRDSGKKFIIIGILNEEYVYIVDGSLRRVEKPKKKKVKHLAFSGEIAQDVREMVLGGKEISNSTVKKLLQSEDTNKEV